MCLWWGHEQFHGHLKKQPLVTLSTIEVELFKVLYLNKKSFIIMHFDNVSSIKLAKNPIFHNRSA